MTDQDNIGELVKDRPIVMRIPNTDLHSGLVTLAKTFAESKPKLMVEIGAYTGESLDIFRKYLPEDCKIISIDPWLNHYDKDDLASEHAKMITVEEEYDRRFRTHRNVAKLKFLSHEVAHLFADGSIDVLYIDGDHRYQGVKDDITNFVTKINPNTGIIAGHDYDIPRDMFTPTYFQFEPTCHQMRIAVKQAVYDTIGKPDMLFTDTSWLKYTRNI